MEVMNLAEIMDRSIEVLKKNLKTLILFNVGFGIIVFIGIMAFIVITSISVVTLTMVLGWWAGAIVFSIMGVVLFGITMSLIIGTTKIASQEFTGEKLYAFDAIKISLKKAQDVVGVFVLGTIMYIPVIAIAVFLFYTIFRGIDTSMILYETMTMGIITSVILGILATLIIGGVTIIYVSLFIFSLPIIAIENVGVVKALKKSFQMVKKNLWKIVGYNILFYFTIAAIRTSLESFIALVVAIIFIIGRLFNANQDYMNMLYTISPIIRMPLNIISYIIFTPISTIMITLLYFNERFKQEGLDLLLKLKEIKKNDERKLS